MAASFIAVLRGEQLEEILVLIPYDWVDRAVPKRAKSALRRARDELSWRATRVSHRSRFNTIQHCCVQKTASRWFRLILSDRLVYKYSGLRQYEPRSERLGPFPDRTIVGPLYVDYDTLTAIPKSGATRTFFVTRDPRDIIVSWYFSRLYTHDLQDSVAKGRAVLRTLSKSDGLLHALREHENVFGILRSWWEASTAEGSEIILVRYEDATSDAAFPTFRRLFAECDIQMPGHVIYQLLAKYSFEQLSRRRPGEENRKSKLRKGIAGDWKNHFDDTLVKEFNARTGDLLQLLGYESSENW